MRGRLKSIIQNDEMNLPSRQVRQQISKNDKIKTFQAASSDFFLFLQLE